MQSGCFICNGPLWARDCPKKEIISALMTEKSQKEDSGSKKASIRLNPLQLLNAICSEELLYLGLLYMNVNLRGEKLLALVDLGATNNFIM